MEGPFDRPLSSSKEIDLFFQEVEVCGEYTCFHPKQQRGLISEVDGGWGGVNLITDSGYMTSLR